MRHVCEYAERNGVLIALEPEPYVWYLVNYLASAGEMLEDVARPNIGLLVDLGHMALAREGLDDLRPLANQILHVHLSDHEAYRHTNQPIGSGFVPVVDYLGGLLSLNVDGIAGRFGYEEMVVTLELGATGDTIQDPDSWARRSLAYVLGTGLPIRLR
jgi:sugar phosphate isomerase/epimerase